MQHGLSWWTVHRVLVAAAAALLPPPAPTTVLGIDETRTRRVRWLLEGTLGSWLARDRRRRGEQPAEQVNEGERVELVRLRRENAQLRMEKEILKEAAAFFATESTR